MSDYSLIVLARDLFTRCGKKLQRRRQENEWRLAVSRISVDVDPAEQNIELQKKLADNKQVATKRETEVFNKYVSADFLHILSLCCDLNWTCGLRHFCHNATSCLILQIVTDGNDAKSRQSRLDFYF